MTDWGVADRRWNVLMKKRLLGMRRRGAKTSPNLVVVSSAFGMRLTKRSVGEVANAGLAEPERAADVVVVVVAVDVAVVVDGTVVVVVELVVDDKFAVVVVVGLGIFSTSKKRRCVFTKNNLP